MSKPTPTTDHECGDLERIHAELLTTREGQQTWRLTGDPHGVFSIEYGPENDPSDCYDLLEDPPRAALELLIALKERLPDIVALMRHLERDAEHVRQENIATLKDSIRNLKRMIDMQDENRRLREKVQQLQGTLTTTTATTIESPAVNPVNTSTMCSQHYTPLVHLPVVAAWDCPQCLAIEKTDLLSEKASLLTENVRLQRGEFSDQEMRQLCYAIPYDTWNKLLQVKRDISSKICGLKKPDNEAERQWLRLHPSLTGQSVCCECGDDYPMADNAIDGHIYCPKCRITEAKG